MTQYIAELLRRARLLLMRDRATRELEEEMQLHRALRADAITKSGVAQHEAEHAASRRFGNRTRIAEESRDMWGFARIDRFTQDLRYAVRRVTTRPGFALSVVAVLALGIGATTAMFSAVDAAMLRPLPFARPSELVGLGGVQVPFDPGPQARRFESSHLIELPDVNGMRDLFTSAAAYAAGGLNLDDDNNPQRIKVGVVTVDFFRTLGVMPHLGRTFDAAEGVPNGPAVAILSWELWQGQYGARDMLNHVIHLNGKPFTVVGVMPRRFSFPDQSQLWIPMSVPTTFATFESFRGFLPSRVVARLTPSVSVAAASQRMLARWEQKIAAADSAARRQYTLNGTVAELKQRGAAVALQQELVGDRKRALTVLLGATGLLLLIACANATNLLLSQAASRRREIAVREVLGATRARIIRQLLTESVILALAGTTLGLLLAPLLLSVMRSLLPNALVGVAPATVNLRVLAFAACLALVTGIAFGLWPAFGTTRRAPGEVIKAGGGHGTTGTGGRARRVLVTVELALTVMLLVGAGLMLRSFAQIMGVDRGMRTDHVGTLEIAFPNGPNQQQPRIAKYHDLLARVSAIPGVESAGLVNDLPLGTGGGIAISVDVPGAPPPKNGEPAFARYLIASGGYFRTMGIKLARGRTFTENDGNPGKPVAIISETMAKEFWPNQDPIGRTYKLNSSDTLPITVVGVVADVRERSLDSDPYSQMYFPVEAHYPSNVALVARSTLPAPVLLRHLTEAMRAVDPRQAVFHVRMMDDVVGASVASRRTNTMLIALFALVATILAALGVYAVVAYGVAQRTREFGIRAALGATGRNLVVLVSRDMLWTSFAGIGAGLVGAWLLARVIASMLYGVEMHDIATFIAVPLLLFVPTALATLIPARRTLRVNPAEVIRSD